MSKYIAELVAEYLPEDPTRWGKLSREIQWRRLQLMPLKEIFIGLRKLNQATAAKMI